MILSLVLIGVTIYFKKCNSSDKAATPDSAKGKQALNVSAVVLSVKTLEYKLYSSGTVMANEEVQLRKIELANQKRERKLLKKQKELK